MSIAQWWSPDVVRAFDALPTTRPQSSGANHAQQIDGVPGGVFVISMGGERLDTARQTLEKMGVDNYHVWPAVVGKSIVDADTGSVDAEFAPLFSARTLTALARGRDTAKDLNKAGAAGCSLSHIGVWKYVVDKNLPAVVVFEDDIAPVDPDLDAPQAIAQAVANAGGIEAFDVLWLYHAAMIGHGKEQTADWSSDTKRTRGPGWCTLAYVLTQRGARALLRDALPLISTIDTYMYDVAAAYPNFVMLRTNKNIFKHSIANSSIGYNVRDLLTSVSSTSYTYAAAGLALALLVTIVTIIVLVAVKCRTCPAQPFTSTTASTGATPIASLP